MTDQLLEKLVKRMFALPTIPVFHEKKYLSIFRSFCIVGDTINTSNQTKILVQFIKKLG